VLASTSRLNPISRLRFLPKVVLEPNLIL